MNNKGFTLVELLATIVILGLVMGIASVGVASAIQASRLRSEKIFVEKIGRLVDDYLGLKGSSLPTTGEALSFSKCGGEGCEAEAYELESITFQSLVDEGLVDYSSMVNPSNKKNCLEKEGGGPAIRIFKDDDYVYYYYVDLSGPKTSCDISEDNGILSTIPDSLYDKIEIR